MPPARPTLTSSAQCRTGLVITCCPPDGPASRALAGRTGLSKPTVGQACPAWSTRASSWRAAARADGARGGLAPWSTGHAAGCAVAIPQAPGAGRAGGRAGRHRRSGSVRPDGARCPGRCHRAAPGAGDSRPARIDERWPPGGASRHREHRQPGRSGWSDRRAPHRALSHGQARRAGGANKVSGSAQSSTTACTGRLSPSDPWVLGGDRRRRASISPGMVPPSSAVECWSGVLTGWRPRSPTRQRVCSAKVRSVRSSGRWVDRRGRQRLGSHHRRCRAGGAVLDRGGATPGGRRRGPDRGAGRVPPPRPAAVVLGGSWTATRPSSASCETPWRARAGSGRGARA